MYFIYEIAVEDIWILILSRKENLDVALPKRIDLIEF